MKTTFLPSRRWIGWGGLLLLMLVMVSCNQEEPATTKPKAEGPWKLALQYEQARIQGDERKQLSLLVPEDQRTASLNPEKEITNPDRKIPDDYRLMEYKEKEGLYYYHLQYRHPTMNHEVNSFFKAIKTKEGWRLKYAFDRPAFEYETQDLEGLLIKGVHDQP
ncbi:hypothetical protein GCM10007416_34090 [Kroppenstedtia guangzhouensis]|uniref:Lipoprotein n=1 Tax=Kroppenstedtia guangzhouensis TaxID=1274356 RepID=A0ABQ1H5H5_9BACL|nr:hypothetical protein [Kroppenstedtia guangzhouensis]GGA58064.1 hypothetical protein GCM10007416_34090 [Kroppenstedtia guangzhouensis]